MPIKKSRFTRINTLGGLAARLAGTAVVGVSDRLTLGREAAAAKLHQATAERLLATLGGMKGLPMKVGQILSFMDGAIPAQYAPIYKKVLSTLQVKAEPQSWDEMKVTFEEEFGGPPEEIFAKFNPEPLAAASIGQVYEAELIDGRSVAVKIQYPEIAEAVKSDLKNVETILKTFRAILPSFDNRQMAQDFLTRFSEELDYQLEAQHQTTFLQAWKDDPKVIIPAPVSELCRRRVLVTEFHRGQSFNEILESASPSEKSAYGETLFRFTFKSILSFGLFNADPHPGNYLFQKDGRVVFLDFGAVQRYNEDSRRAFDRLLHEILAGARGDKLWSTLEETLLIEPGTSDVVKEMFLEYLLFALEPLLAEQPYRYTTEFTSRVSEMSAEMKFSMAKKLHKIRWREPKREGLAPLIRILFGLNSVLASLEAESDWHSAILKSTSQNA